MSFVSSLNGKAGAVDGRQGRVEIYVGFGLGMNGLRMNGYRVSGFLRDRLRGNGLGLNGISGFRLWVRDWNVDGFANGDDMRSGNGDRDGFGLEDGDGDGQGSWVEFNGFGADNGIGNLDGLWGHVNGWVCDWLLWDRFVDDWLLDDWLLEDWLLRYWLWGDWFGGNRLFTFTSSFFVGNATSLDLHFCHIVNRNEVIISFVCLSLQLRLGCEVMTLDPFVIINIVSVKSNTFLLHRHHPKLFPLPWRGH